MSEGTVTLEELENSLPNGLHDAEVRNFAVDYMGRTLTLDLSLWVGDMGDPPELREAYRTGRLEFSGLQFLVVEPPDPKYRFQDSGPLTIDGCDMSKNLDTALLQSLPCDAFVRSLWVNEWNAFMHIAAKKVDILWTSEKSLHRTQREHFRPGEKIDLT